MTGDRPARDSLRPAYEATRYLIHLEDGVLEVRIGRRSARLDALLHHFGTAVAVIVTAENPASRVLPAAENAARNAELRERLAALGFATLPHTAECDPAAGPWPAEHGFVVPGLDRTAGLLIAAAFGQYAIVTLGRRRPAELAFTTLADVHHRP